MVRGYLENLVQQNLLSTGRTSGPLLRAGEHGLADGIQKNRPCGPGFGVELQIERAAKRPKQCVAQRAVMLGPYVVVHVAGSEFGQLRAQLVEAIQAVDHSLEHGDQLGCLLTNVDVK
jgi:hypothetical protein